MTGRGRDTPDVTMLSTLMRPFRASQRDEQGKQNQPRRGPVPGEYSQFRHATADFTEADDDDEDDESNQEGDDRGGDHEGEDDDGEDNRGDEDGLPESTNVLPLFSASHLDSLPVYSITHAIRIIVQTRTETTLTWDQLRSPQVSQFLVKPMQQQIRTQHFSRATLYALMANCLQFSKEGQLYPGNAGTSGTRAKVCELLAIKILKEYSTRELIDALSYDFYPLQGIPGSHAPHTPSGKQKPVASRTSTLEVAIRASAKHFLAHPLVVQQLEAIWNGAITFYSAADQLHREVSKPSFAGPSSPRHRGGERTPLLGSQQGKEDHIRFQLPSQGRRTVMLYNPRNASLFKLSRLRVPRYRQLLSTLSLGVLIILFLAVLVRRSSQLTSLELIFWFWSAGFMLDELVGFTEQGFSLYIMSFWNIFDLGILMLLIVYYCMRIWGVFLLDPHKWNDNAYDVLAANAVLLLPRIFSVLDHYQYFSQLLIAFRLMAIDLAAVLVLVLISCSGFFVFFTLSSNQPQNDAGLVAYKIFQILMGFTPAAWEVWPEYNWLGRLLMALFLIICHFVVVTILITVLTNSFMSIASNAQQEHQFLFAINTISMVKNDALFSYIAPTNIFAWLLMPLRYCIPLKQFVWLNRFVIKVTHFPVLFCIYVYERYILLRSMYEPTDLVENLPGGRHRAFSFSDPTTRTALFSPNVRVREESLAGYQKDRALDELFRRVPDAATMRTQRRNERRRTQNAIRTWMDQNDGGFNSPHNFPTVDSRTGTERQRRPSVSREQSRRFRQLSEVRSAASDPADLLSNTAFPLDSEFFSDLASRREHAADMKENPDNSEADGDDELVTNDEDEEDNATNTVENQSHIAHTAEDGEDYFTTPIAARFSNAELAAAASPMVARQRTPVSPRSGRRAAMHNRTMSTNTILYAPQDMQQPHSVSSESMGPSSHPQSHPISSRQTPVQTPTPANPSGRRSPRRPLYVASRPRPILPPRDMARTAPNRSAMPAGDISTRRAPPRRLNSLDIDTSSTLNAEMMVDDTFGAVPSSFATQMAMATGFLVKGRGGGDTNRISRLMLAKMKTLEESLSDVVREMRVIRSAVPSTAQNSGDDLSTRGRHHKTASGSGSSGLFSGPAIIEVAGRQRGEQKRSQTATSKLGNTRPASSRSMSKVLQAGLEPGVDNNAGLSIKGKEKTIETPIDEPRYEEDSPDDELDVEFGRRSSSV